MSLILYQDLTDVELRDEALSLSEQIYNGTYTSEEFVDSDFTSLIALTKQLEKVYEEVARRQNDARTDQNTHS